MGEQAIASALERFIERARDAVKTGEGSAMRERIGMLLQELGRSGAVSTDVIDRQLHGSSASFTILKHDASGVTLMLSRFSPDEATPVHDHKSWGVAYVLRGTDRHKHWRRVDDGAAPGRARLVVDDEREVRAGEFVHWGAPPDDIHSQQGVGGDAYELVCFGQDPTVRLRNYFDPESGTVVERMPA